MGLICRGNTRRVFKIALFLNNWGKVSIENYSVVSIEFTILIFAIERKGIAVADKQATMDMSAASIIDKYGIETNCR